MGDAAVEVKQKDEEKSIHAIHRKDEEEEVEDMVIVALRCVPLSITIFHRSGGWD